MRFLVLLRGGATPKVVAERFLESFFHSSDERGDLSFEHAANFVMDCFGAINLKLTITENDAKNSFRQFQWPVESLRIYVFMYNKITFSPFEQFLYELFIITRKIQDSWVNTYKEEFTGNYMEQYVTPLDWLLQLIAVWNFAYKQILSPGNTEYFTTYLDEPISRINYQLLRGARYLRRFYHTNMHILNNICDSLLRTAQLGIMYEESHHEVVSGLLNMFNEDFHLFYEFSHSSTDFYYRILTTECSKTSHQNVYKSFIQLLQKYSINYQDENRENENPIAEQRSRMITNFMVDSKLLNLYYHTLEKEKDMRIGYTILEFLYVLQSKLVSLDCFPEVFMESILALVLSIDEKKANKAAKLYITMMERRSNDESIIKNIIKYFFIKKSTIESIPIYVKRLSKYFQRMEDINYYIGTLQQRSIEAEPARLMTAHFVVTIFKCMLVKHGLSDGTLISFLLTLMDTLKHLKCEVTQGILLDVFDVIYKSNIQNVEVDLKKIFIVFEECSQHRFVSLENIQYPLLKKWFVIWEALTSYTGNIHQLEEASLEITTQYMEFRHSKEDFFQNANKQDLVKYRCLLQRICLLTQSNHLTCDIQSDIFSDIGKGLMNSDQSDGIFYEYAFKFKEFIDVYALEIYTIGLISIYTKGIRSTDRSQDQLLKSKVQEFEKHLRTWILNTDVIVKQPMIRIKTFFICFLELHVIFRSDSKTKIFDLQAKTYEILVRLITFLLFKPEGIPTKFDECNEDTQVHPLRALTYQRLMIERFGNFHKYMGTKIDSHFIWHFCLYYGLPQANKFQKELYEFLQILVRHNFLIYQQILPIIIFSFYTDQLDLKNQTILAAIKAHKTFIDNLPINDRALLNIHIVLAVIDRLNTYVKSTTINDQRDRLAALKHLHKFVENLILRGDVERIYTETKKLRKNLLSKIEHKTLDEFLELVKAHFKV